MYWVSALKYSCCKNLRGFLYPVPLLLLASGNNKLGTHWTHTILSQSISFNIKKNADEFKPDILDNLWIVYQMSSSTSMILNIINIIC